MIVECPRCRARYRVEQDLLERDQTFKCSRCGHIFAYEAAETAQPETSVPPPTREAEPEPPPRPESRKPSPRRDADSLSFSFSRAAEHAAAEAAEHEAPAIEKRAAVGAASEEEFTFDDDAQHLADEHDGDGAATIDDEPRFVRGEEDLRLEESRRETGGRPYLVFLVALVVVYAIVTLDLRNHPARAERLLASVPGIGAMLAEDNLLQTRVQLQDVEGVYQQIKDDKLVFIVSGRAVNTAPAALKGVQIESVLYDAGGKPVETKSIYCGNAMSLKIVKDLSTKEISLLQRLEPPKRFEIRSGESAGFSVVFVGPPAGLKEFSTRVVAAQPAAA